MQFAAPDMAAKALSRHREYMGSRYVLCGAPERGSACCPALCDWQLTGSNGPLVLKTLSSSILLIPRTQDFRFKFQKSWLHLSETITLWLTTYLF